MIWLDPQMTSPYRMYQYWINTDDRDVIKFLKLFTFLELTAIGELEESLKQDPGKREPHRALAFEFTRLAHGENRILSIITVLSPQRQLLMQSGRSFPQAEGKPLRSRMPA